MGPNSLPSILHTLTIALSEVSLSPIVLSFEFFNKNVSCSLRIAHAHFTTCDALTSVDATYDEELKKNEKE
jgi:D-ribose pyranose/furanose isomerase RbsD